MNAAPVYDIQARRASRRVDKASIVKGLQEGSESVQAQVESLPFVSIRESHIVAVERSLVAMQSLLIDLRAHVPGEPRGAA